MKSMFDRLRNQNLVFIATIILTIVIGQVIIQYDLNKQNEDARLINYAGRQRMLSQRISKLTLYLYNEVSVNQLNTGRLDTLRRLASEWDHAHEGLLKGIKEENSPAIDSLLKANTPHLKEMLRACQLILDKQDASTLDSAVNIIALHELPFLWLMERTVSTYQSEAEEKLATLKGLEIGLSLVAITILILEFIIIFMPTLRQLKESNENLIVSNHELSSLNEELQASEEEIRANLDHINILQGHLESSERQFRELVNNAQDLIYELDPEGKFSFVNPIMESLTGYSKEELLRMRYWEVINPDQRESVVEFYKTQRKEFRESSYLEFVMLSKTNEEIWIGQNVRMFFEGKWVIKISAVARDITKLKKAGRALEESELRFRTLAENAPVGIFELFPNREVEYINKRWFDITGVGSLNREERINAIHPEDRDYVMESSKKAFEDGSEWSSEFRYLTEKKGLTWVVSSVTGIIDDKGNISGYIGTTIDITAQKQAEIEIKKREKLYRLISENSHDVISLNDMDGRFEYISPACKELHGYTPEELVGRLGTDFIVPEDVKMIEAQIPEVRRKMENHEPLPSMQFRLITKNRGIVWVENVMKPYFENDKLLGFQATLRDISERKHTEELLRNEKDKAESATLAKSQFLSMMSHEIRTPMNAIIGLTNLMLDDEPREDQLESFKLLKFSGENLLTIINDVLDFSKIEAGKIELENEPLQLSELIQYHINMMETRVQDKGIQLHFHFDKNIPISVKGDSVRLGQVINNLLSNAIKFTEKGYVEINVSVLSDEDERQKGQKTCKIQFLVRDTGIGIPKEKLDTVFESFTQASGDTTRKFGGTGLGLSITKKLLLLMDSTIKVESQYGYGSTFSFVLNMEVSDKAVAERSNNPLDKEMQLAYGRILLVEDNRVNQIVASNFLKKWGMEATIANNGKEAVEIIQRKGFDVVLMDLQMPEMDGYEATRQIRGMKDEYFKTVPIIALTASAMMEIRDKTLETGMNDYVSKPFHPEELHNKIGKYIIKKGNNQRMVAMAEGLDLYSEGDAAFKKELAVLFVKNIRELRESLRETIASNDDALFKKVSHKVKTTLGMLGDVEFEKIVDELKAQLTANTGKKAVDLKTLNYFHQLCDSVIKGLEEEVKDINMQS